ncbi:helix-turn-helix domain-containing protein [Kibdelosporangium aridum]|uniref:helix-turn-helix domain-containing protein n=1 Tax=Kibdelosporangium aridum TaxID=2030 RepID=UPI00163B86C3|nr:helix-turn-helix domain-containing protein [Kibdelosporangium aridum]
MDQGVGHCEAARRVNYRTVRCWRAAPRAAAEAAVVASPRSMSSRFLSLDERIVIADRLHWPGMSLRAIATRLGRAVWTISRELVRDQ